MYFLLPTCFLYFLYLWARKAEFVIKLNQYHPCTEKFQNCSHCHIVVQFNSIIFSWFEILECTSRSSFEKILDYEKVSVSGWKKLDRVWWPVKWRKFHSLLNFLRIGIVTHLDRDALFYQMHCSTHKFDRFRHQIMPISRTCWIRDMESVKNTLSIRARQTIQKCTV